MTNIFDIFTSLNLSFNFCTLMSNEVLPTRINGNISPSNKFPDLYNVNNLKHNKWNQDQVLI